ncbi:hypothetical protein GALL_488600 [mine drainage metagenome]|uniref:Uncharacterized protein n=1 Tax=mine drainage metagenome TaxID=410659 RepID=A0A1J5PW49_9ZZZZ
MVVARLSAPTAVLAILMLSACDKPNPAVAPAPPPAAPKSVTSATRSTPRPGWPGAPAARAAA